MADTFGHAVHVFDLERRRYRTVPVAGDSLIGAGVLGDRLFVTDSASGRLLALDMRGRVVWSRGAADGLVRPTGLTCGPDRVYVVDTMAHRITMWSPDGTRLATFGSRGTGAGEFNYPTHIARDRRGQLYVTDTMNARIQTFDASGGFLRTFGKAGDGPGDLDKPKGVAVDRDGHIYVAEALADTVQIFDQDGQLLLAFGGTGAGPGQLVMPSSLAIVDDIIYVADAANRRVQVFEYIPVPR